MKLTDDLRRALAGRPPEEPLRLTDEEAGTEYLLVRADVFERVRGGQPLGEPPPAEVPEGIRRSRAALRRDLPELLRDRRLHRRWVAYHGDERIGIDKDKVALIRECLRRGLSRDTYYIGMITPAELTEEEEVDRTFVEYEEEIPR